MQKSKIVLNCSPYIAPILKEELIQLGYKNVKEGKLEVSLEGTLEDCMFLNLHIRTATKVLFLMQEFKAKKPEDLYRQIYQFKWEHYLNENGYLCITSFVKNDSITNTQFANVKVKDALVDRLKDKTGSRPNSGPLRNQMVLFLHWFNEKASLYLDTSGESLAKHGYRKIPGKAPMQEALAAATIYASKWNKNSAFINPMCGSGTLAIEAACMVANIPPGLLKEQFGFQFFKTYDEEKWLSLVHQAKEQITTPTAKIFATDISRLAIKAAEQNAEYAGVKEYITFKKCDFRDTPIPEGEGVVFLNPEYGERLGEEKELIPLYQSIGDFFKQECKGKMGYIFTGNLNLAKKIGLRTNRRIPFMNAKIECRLLEYELYGGSKKKKHESQ